ncbi:MAG: methyltransferase domain-containing protein [Mycobacteriales bacterium]|nr:methyltransferase domain-containing protein [Frankia sp.]
MQATGVMAEPAALPTVVRSPMLEVAATMAALAGVRRGHRVVDIGCGLGLASLPAAAATGPTGVVVAFDAQPALLAAARRRDRLGTVRWVQAALPALPLRSGWADRAVSMLRVGTVEEHAGVFAEAARVLGLGGRLVVSVLGGVSRSTPGAAADTGDEIDPHGLQRLLRGAGLTVMHTCESDLAGTDVAESAAGAVRRVHYAVASRDR